MSRPLGRPLEGRIALVTGASRGVGKGIALGLAEAGATVALTARTLHPRDGAPLPGSLEETVAEIEARGGHGVAFGCDHADDDAVARVIARVEGEVGPIEVLVNNVFAVPDGPLFDTPFWAQPIAQWDTMHTIGLRSHYVATVHAAPPMIARGRGLVVHVSSFGGGQYAVSVAYGVGKAGVDRMAKDMAHELRPHGVACVSLWPGIVATERLEAMGDASPFPLRHAQRPVLSGRAVAALAADPSLLDKTGRVLVVADLAREYGFT
ncbi:MAG: SDR family NAD(P)-dependent oxidoreductase [Sandaracinaceae bacterium]|nr:SDR family NAD(P)-dependent oxidoreductase [Sandaracinaceae bacterium]